MGSKDGQIDILLNGKNAMPAWAKQLKDAEIAAVITYTRSAWDNKNPENVMPADIKAARK